MQVLDLYDSGKLHEAENVIKVSNSGLHVLQGDDVGPGLSCPAVHHPGQGSDFLAARLSAQGLAAVGAVRGCVQQANPEIDRREGYELQMRAALENCRKPIHFLGVLEVRTRSEVQGALNRPGFPRRFRVLGNGAFELYRGRAPGSSVVTLYAIADLAAKGEDDQ